MLTWLLILVILGNALQVWYMYRVKRAILDEQRQTRAITRAYYQANMDKLKALMGSMEDYDG